MDTSNKPQTFLAPWGWNAGGSYIRTIPPTTGTPGAASFELGYPPITALALGAGGIPPDIRDMNGILNPVTAWNRWQQAGGPIFFDGTLNTAIGGYPKWSLLMSTTLGRLWQSTVEDNPDDPDSTPTNWRNLTNGRLLDLQIFPSQGTFTYAAAAGVNRLRIRACGAGGAGGGTPVTGSGQVAVGGGGGSGASGEIWLNGNGNGETITVGTPGIAATGAVGGDGGASSFGAFIACPGGGGGTIGVVTAPPRNGGGGSGGGTPSTSGSIVVLQLTGGYPGLVGIVLGLTVGGYSGKGADCPPFGAGAPSVDTGAGGVGSGSGAGGAGAIAYQSTGALAGGNGRAGRVIVEGYSF